MALTDLLYNLDNNMLRITFCFYIGNNVINFKCMVCEL